MDPQQRPRIVALGDLVVDVVASATGPLAHGSDRSARIDFRQGGSAANTARWVARAGGDAVFVGAVGRDVWGRRLHASLTNAGVECHLVHSAAPTARIVALLDASGERTFLTDRGAADRLAAGDLRPSWFAGCAALHLPGYSLYSRPLGEAAERAAELARTAGGIVSVDLASHQPILDLGATEAWRRVAAAAPDLVFGNEAEAAAILDGRPEIDLLELADVVVIKRGAAGCRIIRRGPTDRSPEQGRPDDAFEFAVERVASADTTGAGDAFAAGFLVAWLAATRSRRGDPVVLRSAAEAGAATARHLLTEPRSDALD